VEGPEPSARVPGRPPGLTRLQIALVLALLLLGLGLQLLFFRTYPQPVLFGDPAEYAALGHRLHRAAIRALQHPRGAFAAIRGTLYMLGVSTIFAVLDAVRPGDLAFARVTMALFNTLAMAGVFFLARELALTFRAGILGLALAASYPSFSLQTGRLYPDPITGCLFVWSSFLFVRALRRTSPRLMIASGLVLSAGLLVRSQIIDFTLLLLGVLLVVLVPVWAREKTSRRMTLAFALSLLPLMGGWLAIRAEVGQDVDPLVQGGNETFKPYYPYGFWQYLDSDGWIGPYRLKTEPYARALRAAAESDERLIRSFPAQIRFTFRYVLSRWRESVLLVLDNVYRLYDRPANDYKWDFPFPYWGQVLLQRGVLVLALLGIALFTGERAGLAGAFLMPFVIAVLHGLVFPWPRYNLPVMPILLGAAGAALARLGEARPLGRRMGILALGGMGALLASSLLFDKVPEEARIMALLGWLALLAVPFVLFLPAGAPSKRRAALGAAWIVLATLVLAHAARDRLWHEYAVVLGDDLAGIEQEIRLSPESLEHLRTAGEAFLVFDLVVPDGDLEGVRVQVGGREIPGSRLLPTMPPLPESTTTGGKDGRGYPQWWALPLDPSLLPSSPHDPLKVRLLAGRARLVLKGDRFSGGDRAYEGPSFGDWPHTADLKLEYDGDYRLAVRVPLQSEGTMSRLVRTDGRAVSSRGILRVRAVTLANDEGLVAWVSPRLPTPRAALGFFAYSGRRGMGRLFLGEEPLVELPLGASEDYEATSGLFTLCYRAEASAKSPARGAYFLMGPFDNPGPSSLSLRFRTGMSLDPAFFIVDPSRDVQSLAPAFAACRPPAGLTLVPGVARVLDASRGVYPDTFRSWIRVALGNVPEDQGAVADGVFRWSVSEVF
jgi:hypothetical protein